LGVQTTRTKNKPTEEKREFGGKGGRKSRNHKNEGRKMRKRISPRTPKKKTIQYIQHGNGVKGRQNPTRNTQNKNTKLIKKRKPATGFWQTNWGRGSNEDRCQHQEGGYGGVTHVRWNPSKW